MNDPGVISEAEKAHIVAEERLRAEVAAALAAKAADSPSSGLSAFIHNDNVRWIVTVLLIPFVAFIWSYFADARAQRLELAQKNTALVTALLPYLADRDVASGRQDFALAIVTNLRKTGELPGELEASVQAIAAQLKTKVEQQSASTNDIRQLELIAKSQDFPDSTTTSSRRTVSSSPIVALPTRVYIQIHGETDRAEAERLRALLRQNQIPTPGIENVARTHPDKPPGGFSDLTVLYFNGDDLAAAQQVVQLMREHGFQPGGASPQRRSTGGPAPQGQLEVWFPKHS